MPGVAVVTGLASFPSDPDVDGNVLRRSLHEASTRAIHRGAAKHSVAERKSVPRVIVDSSVMFGNRRKRQPLRRGNDSRKLLRYKPN